MSVSNTINLPKVQFGQYQISRLIMGDNPIYGYAHFNQLLSQHQQEANTSDQVMATLRRAEEVGVNAWQNTLTERSAADLQRYRDEGGTIPLFLSSAEVGTGMTIPHWIDEAAKHNPIGMAPHGSGVAGRCFQENRPGLSFEIFSSVFAIQGFMVGLSVTQPPYY